MAHLTRARELKLEGEIGILCQFGAPRMCAVNHKNNHNNNMNNINNKIRKSFCIEVWGEWACFTRPELKVERVSYEVPTPSALRNLLQAVFWKPAIEWQVTKIEVLNPLKWQSIRRNEVAATASKASLSNPVDIGAKGVRQQRNTLALRDVRYRITADMIYVPVEDRAHKAAKKHDPTPDEGPEKYHTIFTRRASKGQCFTQPYLGCREFPAYYRLVDPEESNLTPPIAESKDLGIMLYDIDFEAKGKEKPSLWYFAKMVNGVIDVPERNSKDILR